MTTINAPAPRLERRRDFGEALSLHALLAPVYALWAWIAGGFVFTWPGGMVWTALWAIVCALLVLWDRERREGLVLRVFHWSVLAAFGPLVLAFLPWVQSRRLLVPPPLGETAVPSTARESDARNLEFSKGLLGLMLGGLWATVWVLAALGGSAIADVEASTWLGVFCAVWLGLAAMVLGTGLLLGARRRAAVWGAPHESAIALAALVLRRVVIVAAALVAAVLALVLPIAALIAFLAYV